MTCLDLAVLGSVHGGQSAPNRTDITTSDGQRVRTERTDFAFCQEFYKRECDKANTSWLFGRDEKASARCALDTVPKACPPSMSRDGD